MPLIYIQTKNMILLKEVMLIKNHRSYPQPIIQRILSFRHIPLTLKLYLHKIENKYKFHLNLLNCSAVLTNRLTSRYSITWYIYICTNWPFLALFMAREYIPIFSPVSIFIVYSFQFRFTEFNFLCHFNNQFCRSIEFTGKSEYQYKRNIKIFYIYILPIQIICTLIAFIVTSGIL